MAIARGNFGKLLEPGLRSIFFDHWKEYPKVYNKVFNVETSKKSREHDLTTSAFPTMPEKTEGGSVVYYDPLQGYETTYLHTTFGMGFKVTREMWEDDLYGVSKKWSRSLSRSANDKIEIDAANIFNRSQTAGYTGADGIVLCSASHPLLHGGTGSNVLGTAADLASTSIVTMLTLIRDTVDDNSKLQNLTPSILLVPTELEWYAKEIMTSGYGSTQGWATYGHITNVFQGIMTPVVMPYITDADSWYVICSEHALNFFWRRKIAFGQDDEFDTENAKFKATMRYSLGWSNWRGVYGTEGAA